MIRTIFFCFLAFGPISAADKDAAAKVDLSPALWPDNEFEQLMKRDQIYPFPKTSAEGKNGMVVTTSSTTATRAGLEALKQGGTAVDAALTTALTQIALNLGSWSSYGGMMVMVVFDAKTGKVYALHGGFQTALAETDPLSVPSDKPHGRAVMVPGFMAAVEAAHKRFGRLPFEQIFTPAIYLAENGFELSPMLGYMIKNREAVIARLPETKAVFAKQDGSLYEARRPVQTNGLGPHAASGLETGRILYVRGPLGRETGRHAPRRGRENDLGGSERLPGDLERGGDGPLSRYPHPRALTPQQGRHGIGFRASAHGRRQARWLRRLPPRRRSALLDDPIRTGRFSARRGSGPGEF